MNKDRFKFRVWDNKKNQYVDDSEVELLLNADGGLLFGDWHGDVHFAESDYIIEQCTGLSDKNGNLIYEGDIIKDKLGRKYQAQWNNTQWLFTGDMVDFYPHILNILYTPTESCEIIGNIHEHKENQ